MRKALSKMSDTAKSHRAAADYLDAVWIECKQAHVAGGSAGVLGGCLTIAGGIATITTGGAATPFLLAGVGIGAAGAGTKWFASYREKAINSSEIKKAEKDLQETIDSINDVKQTVKKWLIEKGKTKLLYICYLAERIRILKFSDPAVIAVIEILREEVFPSVEIETQLESAQRSVARWAAATAVANGVQASSQAAGGFLQGFFQVGARAVAGKLVAGVGAVCMVLDAVDLGYTIQDIVENKKSDAAQCLRQKADELEKVIRPKRVYDAQEVMVYTGLES